MQDKHDISEAMNIQHFELLQRLFLSHRNEDGSAGFDIDKFREVFGNVLGGNLSYDQMTMLFMKIDANSDGTIDWNEFSTYMMMGSLERDDEIQVFDEKAANQSHPVHRDFVKKIMFIQKERKYLSVSREGVVCLWTPALKLVKMLKLSDLNACASWINDVVFLQEQHKLAVVSDNRELSLYDILAIKPRLITQIGPMDQTPLCLHYADRHDDDSHVLLFGDDCGYVNVLFFAKRFFIENVNDNNTTMINPVTLCRRESFQKNNLYLHRKKVHDDWVQKIQFFPEMNSFVSCAAGSNGPSMVIGDLERKSNRSLIVPRGVTCFEFCKRPNFIVTAGKDKIVRFWNPYVLSKAAGSLYGHNAAITNLTVDNEHGHIISLSEDKVIKVWNARSMTCLQTLFDKTLHRPENSISCLHYDHFNRTLLKTCSRVETTPLFRNFKHEVPRSHEAAVVSALFNENFHQVVSGCRNSTIAIWDLEAGQRTFSFPNAHGKTEITAMRFDISGRRLITGSRDGFVNMWNFNNGQILKRMLMETQTEGTRKYILVVGWDRKISIFLDDPEHFEAKPLRVFNGYVGDAQKGHENDILSVAFQSPDLLATSSVDGSIILWNIESGHPKLVLREPFLDIKGIDEKAIEKILFLSQLQQYDDSKHFTPPLVSCHADGDIRFWNATEGRLLHEVSVSEPSAGLCTMAIDANCDFAAFGDSSGHVSVSRVHKELILKGNLKDTDFVITTPKKWKGHALSVTCINFIPTKELIISSAADATIRLWTLQGSFVGIFGQDSAWNLNDISLFQPLPVDVRYDNMIEIDLQNKRFEKLKKAVVTSWKLSPDVKTMKSDEEEEQDVREQRLQKLQQDAIRKWRAFVRHRRDVSDWQLKPEDVAYKVNQPFFKVEFGKKRIQPKQYINVKPDFIYHELDYHGLQELTMPPVPSVVSKHNAVNQRERESRRNEGNKTATASANITKSTSRSATQSKPSRSNHYQSLLNQVTQSMFGVDNKN